MGIEPDNFVVEVRRLIHTTTEEDEQRWIIFGQYKF
jgi:hypothetical protein